MKRIFIGAFASFFAALAMGATTVPSSLINWVTAPSAPSQAANTVFAAPNSSSGVPVFRQLIASDIPTLAPLASPAFTGIATFAARPTFNAATPWDSANLTSPAVTTGNLSQFASTTSAQLAGVLSDETGTGFAVFNSSPALAGTPTTPTASSGTSNTQIANTAFVANTLAAPPAIGSTTPAAGTFTTLKASNSKVVASSSNAQSIPNNAYTVVTTWTAALNQGSNFNASTGVYTAPSAGTYDVRAGFALASATYVAGNAVLAGVYVNGALKVGGAGQTMFAGTVNGRASISTTVSCNAGDTISVVVFQNSGGAVALTGTATDNWLSITQQP